MAVPVNLYDRGSLFGSNLVRMDLDGATAALFSPMDLTPEELKRLGDRLSNNGKLNENPFIKTAKELATNPILWLGIVMAAGPWGKTMNISQLGAAMSEGTQYMRKVNPFIRGLLSPFTALRSLWHTGLMDKTMDVVQTIAEFQARHGDDWQNIVKTTQQKLGRAITERERRLVDAYLRGFHTAEAPLAKQVGIKGIMTPGLEKAMVPEVKEMAVSMRRLLDTAGSEVLKVPNSDQIIEELLDKGVEWVEHGYAPRHTARKGLEAWLGGGTKAAAKEYEGMLRGMGPASGIASSAKVRRGWSLPNEADLKLIEDVFDPQQFQKLVKFGEHRTAQLHEQISMYAETVKILEAQGASDKTFDMYAKGLSRILVIGGLPKETGKIIMDSMRYHTKVDPGSLPHLVDMLAERINPARFTMDPFKWMPKYIRSMGPTYAWLSKGMGKELDSIFAKTGPHAFKIERWQRDMYELNLRPTLRGMQTPKEYARRVWFDDSKLKVREWLQSGSPVSKQIPGSVRKWILDGLDGKINEQSLGGRLASLLYVSSLGLNLSPVSKNLFQNFITTANFLGPANTAKGLGTVAGKLSGLADDMTGGMEFNKAFQKNFDEYYKQFGYEHMLKAMAAGDVAKEAASVGSMAKSGWNKMTSVMMGPFAASEKLNRLWAFYAAHGAATTEGMATEAAGKVARNLTLLTQFGGGALGIPSAIRSVPALGRQFMHFPLRFGEWLYGSLAFHPDPRKISTGVLGRTMAGSAGLYTVFKNLVGLDVGPAMAFSALPFPEYEESPFYPWPLVPPAIGLAGDIVSSLSKGDYEGLPGKAGAMLTPGGLALRRMWRNWHPKYADYNAQNPDGTIPMYNKEGYLLRNETPFQLALRGLGINTMDASQEQATVKWMLAQREKIREFRRAFVQAVADGNTEKANAIQAQWQKKYPQLGPIQFKKSDLTALRNRRQLTRAQRIMEGFPQEYRPFFEEAVSLGAMGHMAQSIDEAGSPGFAF